MWLATQNTPCHTTHRLRTLSGLHTALGFHTSTPTLRKGSATSCVPTLVRGSSTYESGYTRSDSPPLRQGLTTGVLSWHHMCLPDWLGSADPRPGSQVTRLGGTAGFTQCGHVTALTDQPSTYIHCWSADPVNISNHKQATGSHMQCATRMSSLIHTKTIQKSHSPVIPTAEINRNLTTIIVS